VQVECVAPLQNFATRDIQTHSWFVEQGLWNCEISQFSGDPDSSLVALTIDQQIEL